MKLILHDENIFSLKCERSTNVEDGIFNFVVDDIRILRDIYNFKWEKLIIDLGINRSNVFSTEIKENSYYREIKKLFSSKDTEEEYIVKQLIDYYEKNGVGVFTDNVVFRWNGKNEFEAIEYFDSITFEDLIGYSNQKKILMENTLNFINNGKGNNVLLYGDRGTGKSSSVKALINEYSKYGLRIVEIKKSQLYFIPQIIEIARHRKYKFIIFIDDLSFEDFETDYKNFKAIIEGSFGKKPDNVLIYVTSNRRHLVRESFVERENDVHSNETMQEKLSLFDRFGITILFDQPKDELFNEMVIKLARNNGVLMPDTELIKLANEWKILKASRSGRTAQQLVDSLL
ncbi:MAG: ATP-binding protein [Eubacteriaceae bacterium]